MTRATPPGLLIAYFVLTFAASWLCWIPVAAWIPWNTALGRSLVLLGAITPSLVALSLTRWSEGAAGASALLSRVLPRPIAARWYVFAAGYTVAIELTVALLHRVITGAWPRFGETPWAIMLIAVVISTPVQAGEEIGWRGYALPRLAPRMGLAWATIVLGLIWAVWHLPLFFIRDAEAYGQSFPYYVLQVTALSVVFGGLYAHSRGSLFPLMLLHAAINNTKDIVPSVTPGATNTFGLDDVSLVAWLTLALLWVCAAGFVVWMVRTERRPTP